MHSQDHYREANGKETEEYLSKKDTRIGKCG